jgi:hypothetical protein
MEVTRAKARRRADGHYRLHSETHCASSMFIEFATCLPAIAAVFRILAL